MALHDARRPIPASLPKLDGDGRRFVALHLQTFAPLDDPTKRPEPDPLPVMVSLLARPEGREIVASLAHSLALDEIQALRDPDATVPEGLAGLGRDGATRIAEAFRTGPVPEREDTAPDPRLADDVLVLSCAVSERVDAAAAVHRSTLPKDVEAVLRASAVARDVSEAEVDELAFGIARKRAETDLRVDVAREVAPKLERAMIRARFEGNPNYVRGDQIEPYKAGVAKGMRRLHREEPLPAGIELRVARAVVATAGTDLQYLARAIAEALERGRTREADEIRNERKELLGQLQRGTEGLSDLQERSVLRRVYANFTGAEVRDLSEGRGAVLERLPDATARKRVRETVLKLHSDVTQPEPSPWRARHLAIARSQGLAQENDREHGRYLGIER